MSAYSVSSQSRVQFLVANYVKDLLSGSTKTNSNRVIALLVFVSSLYSSHRAWIGEWHSLQHIQSGPAKTQEWVTSLQKKYFNDKIHAYIFVTPVWNSITHLAIIEYTPKKSMTSTLVDLCGLSYVLPESRPSNNFPLVSLWPELPNFV